MGAAVVARRYGPCQLRCGFRYRRTSGQIRFRLVRLRLGACRTKLELKPILTRARPRMDPDAMRPPVKKQRVTGAGDSMIQSARCDVFSEQGSGEICPERAGTGSVVFSGASRSRVFATRGQSAAGTQIRHPRGAESLNALSVCSNAAQQAASVAAAPACFPCRRPGSGGALSLCLIGGAGGRGGSGCALDQLWDKGRGRASAPPYRPVAHEPTQ